MLTTTTTGGSYLNHRQQRASAAAAGIHLMVVVLGERMVVVVYLVSATWHLVCVGTSTHVCVSNDGPWTLLSSLLNMSKRRGLGAAFISNRG